MTTAATRLDDIEQWGVVGAGGAGFPLASKLRAKADTFLVNAAECEPLLHKDQELCAAYARELLDGLKIGMELVGARRGVIGVKKKYDAAIAALKRHAGPEVEWQLLGSYYPAGDEFILVYEATGRVVPPGGLPLDVGCVVNNVETLINLGRRRPVTRKWLGVAGAVRNPITIEAPVGVSISEAIVAAGGPAVERWGLLTGGVMMGRLEEDASAPITKTTGAVIVLPEDHVLLRRYRRSERQARRIARAACDQCSFCTELCPRYLLGHPIEPHIAMRAEGFAGPQLSMTAGAQFCCECNLCTMIACPEDLDPKTICVMNKTRLREAQVAHPASGRASKPHPMFACRRTPISRLKAKLALNQFQDVGPLSEKPLTPDRVTLLLRQHIGVSCEPVVRTGDSVREGDLIGRIPEGQQGAALHASIDGRVVDVNDRAVIIESM